jgi:hypothetical protein
LTLYGNTDKKPRCNLSPERARERSGIYDVMLRGQLTGIFHEDEDKLDFWKLSENRKQGEEAKEPSLCFQIMQIELLTFLIFIIIYVKLLLNSDTK